MPPDPNDPVEAAFQASLAPASGGDEAPLTDDSPSEGPFTAPTPSDPSADTGTGDDPWADLRGEYPQVFGKYGDSPAEWAKALHHAEQALARRAEPQAPAQPIQQVPLSIPGLDLSEDEIMELAQRRPSDAARYVMEHADNLPDDLTQSVLNFWVSVEPWNAMQHQIGQMREQMQTYVQQAQQPQVEYLKTEWATRVEKTLKERNDDWDAYVDRVTDAINNGWVAIPQAAYESPENMVRVMEGILGAVKFNEWQDRQRAQAQAPAQAPPRTQTRSSAPPPPPPSHNGQGYLATVPDEAIIADITGRIT